MEGMSLVEEEEEDEVEESADKEKAPAVSSISAAFLKGENKRERKYFIAGRVGDKTFTQIFDTAAKTSVIPRRIAISLGVKELLLNSPFQCNGFQGSASPEVWIKSICRLKTNLGGGVLPVEYYIAPIDNGWSKKK